MSSYTRKYRSTKRGLARIPPTKKAIPVRVISSVPRLRSFNSMSGTLARTSAILGVSRKCKLNFYTQVVLTTPATNIASVYTFAANGLYDPDITGIGHQPMGFDQLMAIYEHYTVTSSKITVHAIEGKAAVDPSSIAVSLNADSTIVTNIGRIIENGLVKYAMIGPLASGPGKTLTLSCNVDKFMGKKTLNEDDYRGDATVNPTEQVYFDVSVWNADYGSATSQTILLDVLIEYWAVFSEPRPMVQS